MAGSNLGPVAPECLPSDLDNDGDVDLTDFALLQRCFADAGVLAAPSCEE